MQFKEPVSVNPVKLSCLAHLLFCVFETLTLR